MISLLNWVTVIELLKQRKRQCNHKKKKRHSIQGNNNMKDDWISSKNGNWASFYIVKRHFICFSYSFLWFLPCKFVYLFFFIFRISLYIRDIKPLWCKYQNSYAVFYFSFYFAYGVFSMLFFFLILCFCILYPSWASFANSKVI